VAAQFQSLRIFTFYSSELPSGNQTWLAGKYPKDIHGSLWPRFSSLGKPLKTICKYLVDFLFLPCNSTKGMPGDPAAQNFAKSTGPSCRPCSSSSEASCAAASAPQSWPSAAGGYPERPQPLDSKDLEKTGENHHHHHQHHHHFVCVIYMYKYKLHI
jgi:hypothetical protein